MPGFDRDEPPRSGASAAGIAIALPGSALLVCVSVLMRGLSVMRPPWGNMFEFATPGSLAVRPSVLPHQPAA